MPEPSRAASGARAGRPAVEVADRPRPPRVGRPHARSRRRRPAGAGSRIFRAAPQCRALPEQADVVFGQARLFDVHGWDSSVRAGGFRQLLLKTIGTHACGHSGDSVRFGVSDDVYLLASRGPQRHRIPKFSFSRRRILCINTVWSMHGRRLHSPPRDQGPRHGHAPGAPFRAATRATPSTTAGARWRTTWPRRPAAAATEVIWEDARSVISRNDSPDISFRPLAQPVPRLRARLHLLLRAAHAQLPEPVAGPRLRNQALRQAQHRRAAARRARRARATCRSQIAIGTATDCYQPVERELRLTRAVLEVLQRDAATRSARHQVERGRARPRPARADGGAAAGRRVRHRHHARRRTRAHAGAARRRAAPAAAHHPHAGRGRHAGGRERGAADPVRHRGHGAGARSRLGGRRAQRLLHGAAPALGGGAAVPAVAGAALPAARRRA